MDKTKRIAAVLLFSAVFGVSLTGAPSISHAAVTDTQVQQQQTVIHQSIISTQESFVTTLRQYLKLLQLEYIQHLQAKVLQLKNEIHERQTLGVT